MIKLDNWTVFLNKLKDNDEFDKNLKKYLEAIKYISEISVEGIDLLEEREKINEYLKCIVDFIELYSKEYYEIGLIKGFKTNEKLPNGSWKIDGRDYYYYIADQKMKASVYYVRYLNYIDNHLNKNEEAKQKLQEYIYEIAEKLKRDIDITDQNIIDIIDEAIEVTEESQKLRQECIECKALIRASDIEYLKYMLFNNMMREIRYIGAAYQYLWHWELKTKNLFRYVSYDGEKNAIEDDCPKKCFLQVMFSKVISHMNKSSRALCSYSEDPYIDIFKYLKIKKNKEKQLNHITPEGSEIVIKIEDFGNSDTATFDIIKGADVNSIYRNGISHSFYDFVQDGKALKNVERIAYAVELYPELPAREKNSKNTPKNIKELLLEYFRTWVPEVDVKQLMSYIADDKEVVTYGKIEKNFVTVESNTIPKEVTTGTRYRMVFNKNELIYLLLKINVKNTVEEIVNHINIEIDLWNINSWLEKVIKGETQEVYELSGRIAEQITDKKKISIGFKAVIQTSILSSIKNPTLEKCKNLIKQSVKDKIKEYLENRYNGILNSQYKVADCVLNFIHKEHQCPQYISEYNEFEPENGDPEISILKYIIFKRWNNAN